MGKTLSRILVLLPVVALQVASVVILSRWLSAYAPFISAFLSLLAVIFALYIIMKHDESNYKILWLLVILSFPIVGAILYALFGNRRTARPLGKRLEASLKTLPRAHVENPSPACTQLAPAADARMAQTFGYVERLSGYPTLLNRRAEYYPLGDDAFPHMLEALEGAHEYIYFEYFIVEAGVMLDSMLEIMERKLKQGVDVRIMYDDFGSLNTFSKAECNALRSRGFKCVRFNRLIMATGTANYRDHRKMLVIDGEVAFSGGINVADEYINQKERFGHWKDAAFKITGEPVLVFARMFAEFWNAFSDELIPRSAVVPIRQEEGIAEHDGFVLSYYDSPVRPETISNDLYLELLAQSYDYAYFFTPYLLPSDSLLDMFVHTAQRGVDVRIILPGVPDKKIVYRMSRSYYRVLLEAGVKIYEYTPGFVHTKGCVVDDVVGTVGTVNLDFRSLFLHFENNSLFYGATLLSDLKADFLATQEKSRERTLDNIEGGFVRFMVDGALRAFSPLC